MKRTILVFGLIAGCIVSFLMVLNVTNCYRQTDYDTSLWLGYASMIIAFSFVFIGIKNYRDKHNQGVIGFQKAFTIGFWITIIASSMYVLAWLIDYHFFIPDFMEKYSAHMIAEAKSSGLPQIELDKKMAEMNHFKEMYKNPVFMILMTYAEILPVGLLITLISALILKKKAIE